MRLVRFGWLLIIVSACVDTSSTTTPPDQDVYEPPEGDESPDAVFDPNASGDPLVPDQTPGETAESARFFEIGFIDRDGPIVADPADPDIPISANFVTLLRADDGSTHRATEARLAVQNVRFVPPADPANPGPGDGSAVVYDAMPLVEGGRNATGAVALTDLDPDLDNSATPLLDLLTPDNVDIDPVGNRVVACGVNYSPCPCCGIRAKAHLLTLAGGEDVALQDSLNEALGMQLMTGALDCQFGMDGSVIYAAGKGMDGNYALVRAMIGDGAVMAEVVAAGGSQGIRSLDVSPDGMRAVFVNLPEDGGGVTVRHLEGAELPFTLSEANANGGEGWAALQYNQSPRWCDSTHVVWQTIEGTQRTIYLTDVVSRERVDLWSDENRVPLSETWLDCRVREELE
ncbi:MAG: hypothetical protein HYY06_23335 [Deltaproteobacteria bacterium]|nr:hypothetical protein [Deltaproteobacteria bacterium]